MHFQLSTTFARFRRVGGELLIIAINPHYFVIRYAQVWLNPPKENQAEKGQNLKVA